MGEPSLRGMYHDREPCAFRREKKVRFFPVRPHGHTQLPNEADLRVLSRPLTNIQRSLRALREAGTLPRGRSGCALMALLAPLLAWSGSTRLPPGGLGLIPCRTAARAVRLGVWRMCAEDAAPATAPAPTPVADVLLMDAMEALRNDDIDLAIATMSKARAQTEQDRNAPIGSERSTLLALVQARVDAAEAKRNLATSTKREQSFAANATMEGDKIVSQVSGAIVRKDFAEAHELLQRARRCFADAGGVVERDREYLLGNLFASLRAEQERVARVKELLRQKELVERARAKKKTDALGLGDEDEDVQFTLK